MCIYMFAYIYISVSIILCHSIYTCMYTYNLCMCIYVCAHVCTHAYIYINPTSSAPLVEL